MATPAAREELISQFAAITEVADREAIARYLHGTTWNLEMSLERFLTEGAEAVLTAPAIEAASPRPPALSIPASGSAAIPIASPSSSSAAPVEPAPAASASSSSDAVPVAAVVAEVAPVSASTAALSELPGLFSDDAEDVKSSSEASSSSSSSSASASKRPDDRITFAGDLYEQRANLLKTGQFSDCLLHLGPEREPIKAHRALLLGHGPFFDQAFASDSPASELDLPASVSKSAARDLIEFLYCGALKVPKNEQGRVSDALFAALALGLEEAQVSLSKGAFSSPAAVGSTFARLTAAASPAPALLAECRKYFEESEDHAAELSKPETVANCSLEIIREILKSNTIPLTELNIFQIAAAWCKAQHAKVVDSKSAAKSLPEIYEQVKDCVNLDDLSFAQIRDSVHATGVFSEEALLDMYLKAKAENDEKLRSIKTLGVLECWRNTVPGTFGRQWSYGGTNPDRLGFEVNRRVRIFGFGVYVARGTYRITIDVRRSGTVLTSTEHNIVCDVDRRIEHLYFRKSIVLEPAIRYEAVELCVGPTSASVETPRHSATVGDVTFTFFAATGGSNNGTDVNNGQIPLFLFRPSAAL